MESIVFQILGKSAMLSYSVGHHLAFVAKDLWKPLNTSAKVARATPAVLRFSCD